MELIDKGKDADRAAKLKQFAVRWAPLPIAQEARTRRNSVAAGILETINALTSDKLKYYRLRSFIRIYADTPSADEARKTLKELLEALKTKSRN